MSPQTSFETQGHGAPPNQDARTGVSVIDEGRGSDEKTSERWGATWNLNSAKCVLSFLFSQLYRGELCALEIWIFSQCHGAPGITGALQCAKRYRMA